MKPMERPLPDALVKRLALCACLVATLGCSLHKANQAFQEKRYDDAVSTYREILQKNPENVQARIGLRRCAPLAAEQHLNKAREAQKRGLDEQVSKEVREAYRLDPANAVAQDWIANLELTAQKRKAQAAAEESLELQKTKGETKNAILLNPRSMEGMDLNFVRKTSLREILAAISKASGVSIILHASYQDTSVTTDLRGLSFQRILDTLMLQSDLFYKVIDTNTIMVFKNTPQNRDQFENQLLKTFYLSNAEVDNVRAVFQTLMPQMKVIVDKRLNAITIKARPTDLTIAKRIVNQLDKAKAEVMVYLELLEVTENSLEQVGLLPVITAADTSGTYRIGATIDNSGSANQSVGGIHISKSDVRFLFPSLALDALKSTGDAKLVASPNIRVVSGESGEINIGEKISTTQSSLSIPGTTSSTTTSTTSSSTLTAQTSYSYEDVGVKIKVEPRVHFNGDISLKIESAVTTLKSGSVAGRPDLGRREIKTYARLQDGETAVFGGLLKEEEQKSLQGFWGISDIPVLGKLLGSNYKKRAKTDVLLTIRAVLVRKPDLMEEDFEAFDPDLATSKAGPFTAKDAKQSQGNLADAPAKPEENPEPLPPVNQPAPSSLRQSPAPPAGQPADPSLGLPVPSPNNPSPEPPPPPSGASLSNQPARASKPPAPPEQDLVLFLSPLASTLAKGQHTRLTLLVSGGQGVTSGTIEIRVDPKLKIHAITAGDFLSGEGGSLDRSAGSDGLLRITFNRTVARSDSGTLAMFDLEGTATGTAPVLIQSGQYKAGANPLSARVVNALVTVE